MSAAFISHLQSQIEATKEDGLYKKERVITSQQQADIGVANGEHVINFCANNYLGLANNESLIEAAKKGLDSHGFGVASVRFICGTQDIHKQLEASISDFLGTEDTILYPSCFDANGGLFETLLGPEDAIISDALNHASIIDGVRLCKAKRYRYANNDMAALEEQLKQAEAEGARFTPPGMGFHHSYHPISRGVSLTALGGWAMMKVAAAGHRLHAAVSVCRVPRRGQGEQPRNPR